MPGALRAQARRLSRSQAEADDLLQDAFLAALEAGRSDFTSARTQAWLHGVLRNKAKMAARSAVRRRAREAEAAPTAPDAINRIEPDLRPLPPALRQVAILALAGATRAEIAWLLGLSDAALRQRISQLKRMVARRGDRPEPVLTGCLPFGAMRRDLIGPLRRMRGFLASHDPDGHLFIVSRSQSAAARQQTSG